MDDVIYRIVGMEDWQRARERGRVPRCGADQRDGFVHLSTREDHLETAARFFEAVESPVALEIDPAALGGALEWTAGEAGRLEPRLHAPGIPLAAIRAVIHLRIADEAFVHGEREALQTNHPGRQERAS